MANGTVPEAPAPDEDEAESEFLQTDSIWGTQYFTPHRRVPTTIDIENRPRVAEEQSADTTIGTTVTQKESANYNTKLSVRTETAEISKRKMFVLGSLNRKRLRRAIVLSEILSPPRALRPLQDDRSH